MNRRQFQAQLASLILVNATLQTPKRGRPSSGKGSPATQTVTSGSPLNAQKRPSKRCAHLPLDVRKDLVAHFPRKTGRGRCRQCNKGYTNTQCRKCDVRLCFSDNRDCFWDFRHQWKSSWPMSWNKKKRGKTRVLSCLIFLIFLINYFIKIWLMCDYY